MLKWQEEFLKALGSGKKFIMLRYRCNGRSSIKHYLNEYMDKKITPTEVIFDELVKEIHEENSNRTITDS